MEKIEKLEGSYDVPQLKQKLNEIIDYLNTQPQEEEKTKLVMPPSAYEQAEKEGFNMKNKVKSELLPKSTPEQKEEWEEEFMEVLETFKDEICSNFFASSKPLTNFIKQLLSERERWAIDTFLKDTASYNSFHNGRPRTMRNGLSGEGFEVRVSKLNK